MPLLRIIYAVLVAASTSLSTATTSPVKEFDWASIVPSSHLQYHGCYGGRFKCARLSVPLDWHNASDARLAHIAMVKLPAVVPTDDATFGGTIIVNHGGPGLSGVSYLVQNGVNIQRLLVDIPDKRHYEIVAFDPRGVGRTTPAVDCFRSDESARTTWALENHARGPLNSKQAIGYGLGIMAFHASRCKAEDGARPETEAMAFVNTPSVARDMVEMVDRIDELRKGVSKDKDKDAEVVRIQYIGWSYGSVLGNYFASMFPGRVGRMVLDGVMDPRDYATGDGWLSNTQDSDKLFGQFWQSCFNVSYEKCPFLKTDKDWQSAQKRFDKWADHLDKYPVAVSSPSSRLMALRGEDIRRIVAGALYSPLQHFQPLAKALHEGMGGSLDEWFQWVDLEMSSNHSSSIKEEQSAAVLCGDGTSITNRTVEWWEGIVAHQRKQSKLFGYSWASIRFSCAIWPFSRNWNFQGPFRSPTHSPSLEMGRPAAPLLFLGSQLDPVTPFAGVVEAAKSHAGSVVVQQQSLGHTAWASAPSRCTWDIVAQYLFRGTIPEMGTVCEADCAPWEAKCDGYEVTKSFDLDEGGWEAMFGVKQLKQPSRGMPLGLVT
ncbi:TAP-like domain-containing protein [Trichoderma austrokoningii]